MGVTLSRGAEETAAPLPKWTSKRKESKLLMNETIWVNLDPDRIDLTTLERRFAGKYRLIARAIPGNDPGQVLEQAMQADVVISILEKWDESALRNVRGKVRMLQKYGMGLGHIARHLARMLSCFDLMQPNAALVNTCRGGVINEDDLVQALRSGRLSAAGLDVLKEEPPRLDNPLMQMDNVFISSHMGAESFEAGRRTQEIMADNIEMFLERGELSPLVQNRNALCGGKGV